MLAFELDQPNLSRLAGESGAADRPPASDASQSPLSSVHTTSFPHILDRLGASLAVTTYQAGKFVFVRAEPRLGEKGPVLNTHFRGFSKPMGFAWEPGRFALGTNTEVWEFHDMPAVAAKLDTPESPGHHDAAFSGKTWATPTAR